MAPICAGFVSCHRPYERSFIVGCPLLIVLRSCPTSVSRFPKELQKRRQELLNGPAEDEGDEPVYEAEDIGCDCIQNRGMDSEWEWHKDQQVYVCNGCGEVQ